LENPFKGRSLLGSDGNRQSLAPFGAPSLDDEPAVFSGHADQKAMGSFSRGVAGLKRSFHCIDSLYILPAIF